MKHFEKLSKAVCVVLVIFAFASHAVGTTPRYAYVTNYNSANLSASSNVSAYTVDSSTGALTAVSGSPFAAGTGPYSVTVDPSGKFTYAVNYFSNNVSAYTIDSSTGALTVVSGSPFAAGLQPTSVAIASSSGPRYSVCLLYDPTKAVHGGSNCNSATAAATTCLLPVSWFMPSALPKFPLPLPARSKTLETQTRIMTSASTPRWVARADTFSTSTRRDCLLGRTKSISR
jgi:DNA-binding beta-propeller fold protein YncE